LANSNHLPSQVVNVFKTQLPMKNQSMISKTSRLFSAYGNTLFLLLAILIVLSSCKKKKPENECDAAATGGFEVISRTERQVQEVMDQLMLLPNDSMDYDYTDFYQETVAQMPSSLELRPIAHEVVRYTSIDDNGDPIKLTGLLIYPWSPLGKISAPIVSVNHGTQLLKKFSPSNWKTASASDWKNYPEMAIADIMAIWYGWIIIMPDYQGMGADTTENHPYVIRERLANATADMVIAAQNSMKCDWNAYVKWNGQTFLYGYSEGGYVTMAAARELESRNVALKGVVCMDGPYDLSGTMLTEMLKDTPFPVPYFLPMMLVGYNTLYPETFVYEEMLKEPYLTDIPKYTTGFYDETVVNGIMPPDKILKKVFTDACIDSLQNPESKAYQTMYENNSFVGWTPRSPMLLWHCQNDDCVPFGNFTAAKKRFTELGLSNIEYTAWEPVYPKSGTVHVAVAPRAFYEGSRWIYHHTK
jgi:pimeloyl-ACP methyl ester carboxylesterase